MPVPLNEVERRNAAGLEEPGAERGPVAEAVAVALRPGDEAGGVALPRGAELLLPGGHHRSRLFLVNGRRIQLESADLTARTGTWHELKVTMTGNHIQCFFDGKEHLDVKDDTFKTAGKVGLWSKADARTHFDDFRVEGK